MFRVQNIARASALAEEVPPLKGLRKPLGTLTPGSRTKVRESRPEGRAYLARGYVQTPAHAG